MKKLNFVNYFFIICALFFIVIGIFLTPLQGILYELMSYFTAAVCVFMACINYD